MDKRQLYSTYLNILSEELIPAAGCTEPSAIAYAAAMAKEHLALFPQRITVKCSPNLIKNTNDVVVPNTNGMTGIEISAVLGVVAGKTEKQLQVLEGITEADIEKAKQLIAQKFCTVETLTGVGGLYLIVTAYSGESYCEVSLKNTHTNIFKIEKDGRIILHKDTNENAITPRTDRSVLSIDGIVEFAQAIEISDVEPVLKRQIEYNLAIANEGLARRYGSTVGKLLYEDKEMDVFCKAKAYAAAGSDARMSGCALPVIINSGSGNQGLTASLPVIIYATEKGTSRETLYRALLISNLVAIHLKTGIGALSAYCGVVSAASGAGAGITYLAGGNVDQIKSTIINTIGCISGMVCDGAKASCAAKIAVALDSAFLAHKLAMKKVTLKANGIVKADVEDTIEAVSRLASSGMKSTDEEIIQIILNR